MNTNYKNNSISLISVTLKNNGLKINIKNKMNKCIKVTTMEV